MTVSQFRDFVFLGLARIPERIGLTGGDSGWTGFNVLLVGGIGNGFGIWLPHSIKVKVISLAGLI